MIPFLKDPKDSTRRLVELIHIFNEVAVYKINHQNRVAFLYTNNELTEQEVRKVIAFCRTSSSIKYLRINLTKDVKDLYNENCYRLMKEMVHIR
jgi:hypothetical protein